MTDPTCTCNLLSVARQPSPVEGAARTKLPNGRCALRIGGEEGCSHRKRYATSDTLSTLGASRLITKRPVMLLRVATFTTVGRRPRSWSGPCETTFDQYEVIFIVSEGEVGSEGPAGIRLGQIRSLLEFLSVFTRSVCVSSSRI